MWSVVSGSSSYEQEENWERPSDDTMILYIFARSSRRIDQAIRTIEDFIRTEFYSEVHFMIVVGARGFGVVDGSCGDDYDLDDDGDDKDNNTFICL